LAILSFIIHLLTFLQPKSWIKTSNIHDTTTQQNDSLTITHAYNRGKIKKNSKSKMSY